MENIFKSIYDALSGNKKLPLEGELLAKAEKIWEVKNGNWTQEQRKQFAEDLKHWRKVGIAASAEMEIFFQKLDEYQETQVEQKVFKYRVITECTFGGKYRRKGEIIHSVKKLEVPHFELVEG